MKSTELRCSFCGKSQSEIKKLIAGPQVFICDECIVLCVDILLAEGGAVMKTEIEESLSRNLKAEKQSTCDHGSTQTPRKPAVMPEIHNTLLAIRKHVEFMAQLRTALGLSGEDFWAWLLKDEFEGVPRDVPRNVVSISKILNRIKEQKGSLKLQITIGDVVTELYFS
jgi:hypothetical protein